MHLSTISLLSLLPAALAASVSFIIPPSQILPNPSSLPPTTSIQLSTTSKTLTVPISPHNTFTAHNLTQGSYLVETAALPYVFYPVRLDVFRDGSAQASIAFRDNAWGNKGEVLRRGGGGEWELRVTRRGEWYVKREGFSPRKLLMNPMILIAFVSLFALVVIPKIIDNMDPELKKEFEEQQKKTLMAGAGGGFDIASMLGGTGSNSTPVQKGPQGGGKAQGKSKKK